MLIWPILLPPPPPPAIIRKANKLHKSNERSKGKSGIQISFTNQVYKSGIQIRNTNQLDKLGIQISYTVQIKDQKVKSEIQIRSKSETNTKRQSAANITKRIKSNTHTHNTHTTRKHTYLHTLTYICIQWAHYLNIHPTYKTSYNYSRLSPPLL